MQQYFTNLYDGPPFELFGSGHLVSLTIVAGIIAFLVWGSIYMLLARSYRFYEVFFFIGIAGGIQALITPNAGDYGLPHFRAIQTMASHALLVIAMVYMTAIEGFRPTWKSIALNDRRIRACESAR